MCECSFMQCFALLDTKIAEFSELGFYCQYKCYEYDCNAEQGINNAYCYVDQDYDPACA